MAALVLSDPSPHAGRAYTLTGSQALTYADVAAIMSNELGRPICYTQPGLLRYASHAHTELGLPAALVVATSIIYTTARLGLAATTTTDTADLLNRPATTVEQFVSANGTSSSRGLSSDPPPVRHGAVHPAAEVSPPGERDARKPTVHREGVLERQFGPFTYSAPATTRGALSESARRAGRRCPSAVRPSAESCASSQEWAGR